MPFFLYLHYSPNDLKWKIFKNMEYFIHNFVWLHFHLDIFDIIVPVEVFLIFLFFFFVFLQTYPKFGWYFYNGQHVKKKKNNNKLMRFLYCSVKFYDNLLVKWRNVMHLHVALFFWNIVCRFIFRQMKCRSMSASVSVSVSTYSCFFFFTKSIMINKVL